jgi:hypothetical protein
MLRRAEAIGAVRGRTYLQERIGRFVDLWKKWQAAPDQALGYEKTTGGQMVLRGLLHRAGGGAWDDQTVAMSMRETENEINLLVPADLRTPNFDEPQWSFATAGTDADAGAEADEPDGDELGDTTLTGRGRR